MPVINNMRGQVTGVEDMRKIIAGLDDNLLIATQCVQQGGINALATLLRDGCTEERAAYMLACLRLQAEFAREQCQLRGLGQPFPVDETGFN